MRTLTTRPDGHFETSGDSNGSNMETWALENIGWADVDADAQERARLNHYGCEFINVDDIADGEDFLRLAAEYWVDDEAEVVDDEAETAEWDGVYANPTPEVDESMDIILNGLPCYNGVQADEVVEMHEMMVAIASHVLVAKHGMNAELVAMSGQEVLAVVQTACEAAIALGMTPSEIGFTALFNQCGELQALVDEKVEAEKPKPVVAPHGLVMAAPRRDTTPNPVKVAATTISDSTDWLGRFETPHGLAMRCTCGCGQMVLETAARVPGFSDMKSMLGRKRVEVWHLCQMVFAPRHGSNRGFLFTETRDRMIEQLERYEGNLNGNLIVRDNLRASRFVVELSFTDANVFNRLFGKRNKTDAEWDDLEDAAGCSMTNVEELEAKAIPVWEAEAKNLNTVPLRSIGAVVFAWHRNQRAAQEALNVKFARKAMTPQELANETRAKFGLRLR